MKYEHEIYETQLARDHCTRSFPPKRSTSELEIGVPTAGLRVIRCSALKTPLCTIRCLESIKWFTSSLAQIRT